MKVLKYIILSILAFILLLFLVAFTVGFIKGVTETVQSKPTPTVTQTPVATGDTELGNLSDAEKQAFLDGCNGDTPNPQCDCMLNYLLSHYTRAEIISLGNDDGDTAIIGKTAQACTQ